MIFTGAMILARVRDLLIDTGARAFTDAELVRYLNDGRAFMYEARPDLFEEEIDFACVAGSLQTLPASSMRLFEIKHNVSHKNKRQIRLTTDEVFARFRPNWRSMKPATEIEHYLYDEADGSTFEVYPPAVAATQIRLSYCRPVAEYTNAAAPLTEEGETGVAYVDYLLMRCFHKESDSNPGFTDRAAHHKTLFEQTIGLSASTKINLSPNAHREGGKSAGVQA